jgi:hypothetical protein
VDVLPSTSAEGEARRDYGIARVLKNNDTYKVFCLTKIRTLRQGWTGQMEDLRPHLERMYGYKPTHGNFYGGLAKEAMALGLLGWTGRRVRMRRPTSKGRKTDELIRL